MFRYHGICVGLTLCFALSAASFGQQVPVEIRIPEVSGSAGTEQTVPVLISDVTGLDVTASDLLIYYDARVIVAKDIELSGTLTNRWTQAFRVGFVEGSQDTTGLIDIALATANRVPQGFGTLVNIKFEVLDSAAPGAVSSIQLIDAILNNRNPQTTTVDGSFTVLGNTLQGDFNGDCVVNFFDFILFVTRFGSVDTDPGWDPIYDMNSDGTIDFADFLLFIGTFGDSC